ncbi:LysR family transcriptional regulator [Undibacterium sp. TS12]|uniref:LysR family transcriptional regulator n=1 Tax=Undibacterium sp. TS12 TaxID=2908202 RepID=UPI001F4C8C59|nr:LysR family transcriptional regulator [Undibacterium sp. TS12]MCH8622408.1 LysR family transcriptional regulator [Undibacterium sp. TS12]
MLDEIKTFIAVVSDGSFSAVARGQDIAVSSVTRKIDALEAELGVKLFARSSRSITLTDAGTQFLPRARSIVTEMDDARHMLADLHADPSGLLTVTAPTAFGRMHVVPAVASFLERYPLIQMDLHLSDDFVDLLTHRLDVAIRIGVLADSDLVATRLAPMKRLACASPAYLARHGRPDSPEQLLQHNCLSVASTPLPYGWWSFSGVRNEAALPIKGNFKSDDTEALLAAALAGMGIAHLASWMVCDMLRAGKLELLFPDLPAPVKVAQTGIHAVRMPGRSHETKAQLFIAHLKSCFGEVPYWDKF